MADETPRFSSLQVKRLRMGLRNRSLSTNGRRDTLIERKNKAIRTRILMWKMSLQSDQVNYQNHTSDSQSTIEIENFEI